MKCQQILAAPKLLAATALFVSFKITTARAADLSPPVPLVAIRTGQAMPAMDPEP